MAESKLSKGMQTQEVQRPETVCPECQYYKKKNVSESQVGDLVRAMALDHTIDEIVAKVHWGKSTVMRLIHRDKIICKEYSKRIGSQALSDEEKHIQLLKIANKAGISVEFVLEILKENGIETDIV